MYQNSSSIQAVNRLTLDAAQNFYPVSTTDFGSYPEVINISSTVAQQSKYGGVGMSEVVDYAFDKAVSSNPIAMTKDNRPIYELPKEGFLNYKDYDAPVGFTCYYTC